MSHRQSMTDFLYEQITNRIISGDYAPRTKLPPEEAIAQEFDVSRPVVRNALARLKKEGIVEARRGSGTTVVGDFGARRPSFGPVDSVDDLWKCFEFRLAFEPGVAAAAARNHTRPDIDRIAAALQRLLTFRSSDMQEVVAIDMDFHQAIVHASHNRFILGTYEAWRPQIQFTSSMSANLSQAAPALRQKRIVSDHEAVFRNITDRRPADAAEAMTAHITSARDTVFHGRAVPGDVAGSAGGSEIPDPGRIGARG